MLRVLLSLWRVTSYSLAGVTPGCKDADLSLAEIRHVQSTNSSADVSSGVQDHWEPEDNFHDIPCNYGPVMKELATCLVDLQKNDGHSEILDHYSGCGSFAKHLVEITPNEKFGFGFMTPTLKWFLKNIAILVRSFFGAKCNPCGCIDKFAAALEGECSAQPWDAMYCAIIRDTDMDFVDIVNDMQERIAETEDKTAKQDFTMQSMCGLPRCHPPKYKEGYQDMTFEKVLINIGQTGKQFVEFTKIKNALGLQKTTDLDLLETNYLVDRSEIELKNMKRYNNAHDEKEEDLDQAAGIKSFNAPSNLGKAESGTSKSGTA